MLEGDLKKPPSNTRYPSFHNRRTATTKLPPHSGSKRQRVGDRGNFHLDGRYVVRDDADYGSMGGLRSLAVSQEEVNTPMFCALHECKSQNANSNKSAYQKSVLNQTSIMFWLGYLYKKIAQNSCEQQVKIINEKGFDEFKREQKTLVAQISTAVLREARNNRIISQSQRRDAGNRANLPREQREQPISREERLERERQAVLREELRSYQVETSTGLLRNRPVPEQDVESLTTNTNGLTTRELVQHLWDDHQSIFYYEKDLLRQYLEHQERMQDNGGERNLAQIINIMDVKWQRMDRYWFQKHRRLDRKMRTKKDNVSYPGPAPPGNPGALQGSQLGGGQGHPSVQPQSSMSGLPPQAAQGLAPQASSSAPLGSQYPSAPGGMGQQPSQQVQAPHCPGSTTLTAQDAAGIAQPREHPGGHQGQPGQPGGHPAGGYGGSLQPQQPGALGDNHAARHNYNNDG